MPSPLDSHRPPSECWQLAHSAPSNPLNGGWAYNPGVTVLQPWIWPTGQGGIASGYPWNPPSSATQPFSAPSQNQFGFIQSDPGGNAGKETSNMTTTLTGIIGGANHSLSFWWATRYDSGNGNATQSQITVLLNDVPLYLSAPNLSDAGGWAQVTTYFVPTFPALICYTHFHGCVVQP